MLKKQTGISVNARREFLVFWTWQNACKEGREIYLFYAFLPLHLLMSHFVREIPCQQVSVHHGTLRQFLLFTQPKCKRHFHNTPLHQLHKITVQLNTQKWKSVTDLHLHASETPSKSSRWTHCYGAQCLHKFDSYARIETIRWQSKLTTGFSLQEAFVSYTLVLAPSTSNAKNLLSQKMNWIRACVNPCLSLMNWLMALKRFHHQDSHTLLSSAQIGSEEKTVNVGEK